MTLSSKRSWCECGHVKWSHDTGWDAAGCMEASCTCRSYKPLEELIKEAMDWAREREIVLETFTNLLASVTKDGSKKRQAGEKPPWWKDGSHEKAIFSHLNKWKHGEKEDMDSGAHPLVHLAWRALAIAYQETYGQVDPDAAGK